MARKLGPSCKLCRREGEKLFLKGIKCVTDKCVIAKREYAPGQHGKTRRRPKMSNYAMQLREKQKAKRIYGILERQFENYFKKAERAKGVTGEVLLQSLERRIDNLVFRSCFAESRAKARQLVRHHFVKVNGAKVDIPSYLISEGDVITIAGKEDQLKNISKTLQLKGLDELTPCAVIEKGSTKSQKLVTGNLKNIALKAKDLSAPCVVVIGETVSVSDPKTMLKGKRFLTTSSAGLNKDIVREFKNHGADIYCVPMTRIMPNKDKSLIKEIISDIKKYDWLVFTSRPKSTPFAS